MLTENHDVSSDNIVGKKSTDPIVLSENCNNARHSFPHFMRKAHGQETDHDPEVLIVTGEMGSRVSKRAIDRSVLIKEIASASDLDELKRLVEIRHMPELRREDLVVHSVDCFRDSFDTSNDVFLSC